LFLVIVFIKLCIGCCYMFLVLFNFASVAHINVLLGLTLC